MHTTIAPSSAPAAGASGTDQTTTRNTEDAAGSADDAGPSDSPDPDPPQRPAAPPPHANTADDDTISVIVSPTVDRDLDIRWIQDRLTAALRELAAPIRRLAINIVDDAAMAALHAQHCGDASTTDVLTFADVDAEGDVPAVAGVDADIAVCIDEAARQASSRGHDVNREVLLYALHGVLHAIGFDDHDEGAYDRMHAEEDRILRTIGVGAVFHSDDARTPGDDGSAQPVNRHPGSAR